MKNKTIKCCFIGCRREGTTKFPFYTETKYCDYHFKRKQDFLVKEIEKEAELLK